jgi:20S proteasome subunit beta 1
VEGYAKHYVATKLCPVNDRTQDEEAPAVARPADADALLGKRENFEGLRAMYEAEIQHITADGAITQHLPKLIGGLAGSLLHGLIQLGYAYRIGGDLLIAEGLAYMHFSYLSFEAADDDQVLAQQGEPFTRDAALALARSVQKDTALLDELHTHLQAPAFTNVVHGDLQRRVMSFSSDATLGNPVLFNAVKTAVDRFDFRNVNGHFALDFATWLYHLTPTNDFVLLHATTSAWSLHQVEHLLAVDDRVRAWKVWFRMALGAFIMHEAPELPAEDPCEQATTQLTTMPEWDEIIAKTLALEGDVDEHVYKLVQVAHDIATTGARSPDDEGNASPSSFLTATQREFVTRSAALKVISSEFAIAAGHNDPNDA